MTPSTPTAANMLCPPSLFMSPISGMMVSFAPMMVTSSGAQRVCGRNGVDGVRGDVPGVLGVAKVADGDLNVDFGGGGKAARATSRSNSVPIVVVVSPLDVVEDLALP